VGSGGGQERTHREEGCKEWGGGKRGGEKEWRGDEWWSIGMYGKVKEV